jgi:hypothetical protein
VRWEGRWKYIYQDSVWPPIHGREALYDVASGRDIPVAEWPADLTLRNQAIETLENDTAGLRLELANAGSDWLELSLEGELFGPVSTKSANLPCSCVEWKGKRKVELRIPPEEEFGLTVIRVKSDRIQLQGTFFHPSCTGNLPFEIDWPVAALPESKSRSRAVHLDLEACLVGEDDQEPLSTGLAVWWEGPTKPAASTGGLEVDEELVQQLKGLGYVDG